MPLSKRLCDLRACSSGVVAVVTAMVLPVLLGFTSLGVEVGHWYLTQRVMQGAADAAAISAAAQYIADYNAGSVASLTYQTVGTNYASLNGFAIPTSNVCLVISSGDNCSTVRALDARAIVCAHKPCVVVEITQNTALWLDNKGVIAARPGRLARSKRFPPRLSWHAPLSRHKAQRQPRQPMALIAFSPWQTRRVPCWFMAMAILKRIVVFLLMVAAIRMSEHRSVGSPSTAVMPQSMFRRLPSLARQVVLYVLTAGCIVKNMDRLLPYQLPPSSRIRQRQTLMLPP